MAHITDRLHEKKWGVSITYSYPRVKQEGMSWNDCVNSVNVKKLARELHEMGAGYLLWGVIHNSCHMNVPNATYDAIAGTRPGDICATRDIVEELYEELSKTLSGVGVSLLHGKMKDSEKARIMQDFKEKKADFLPS